MRIKEKLQTFCKYLKDYSEVTLERIEQMEMVYCDYKKGHTPPTDGWQPHALIEGAHRHCWVRFAFTTPRAGENEQLILNCASGHTGWDANNPQGLLYLNGQMTQGLDINHTEAYLEPDTQYEALVYFYTGTVDAPFRFQASVSSRNLQAEGLYYDIVTPLDALDFLHENTLEYRQILCTLEQAANLVDTRQPYSPEFYASIDDARAFLLTEFYEKLCTTEGKPTVHCIGHTHIDVEWLWHRAQTREKMQRSFATANALMEKYPEYLFTLSQPELYRYLKEEAPEKYAQLKRWVAENRWEPEGSMWVECDCNLTSGESFVRQLLQGKRFFKEEFGKDNRVLLLPDVFGYSAALPQILKKSGVDFFVTSKISWNDHNLLPVDAFYWEGIDGTRIFTSFITTQGVKKNHEFTRTTSYHTLISAKSVMGCWNRFQQKDYSTHTLLTYGYGDGGGGPVRADLEKQRRLSYGIPGLPATKTNFLLPYLQQTRQCFDESCQRLGRTPTWVGELYLEFHRGTYTSVAKIKRDNRKSELMLQKSEALSYLDLLQGGSYDAEGLYAAWRKVLHNQFHDILPGSSIREVYDGTDKDYAQVGSYCSALVAEKLAAIGSRLDTRGGILVYNPLGFDRTGAIRVEGTTLELRQSIPAFGWQVVQPEKPLCRVRVEGLTAENDHYILTLDEAGQITSLWDKAAGREVLKAPGNAFTAYEDRPYRYHNWEISDYYRAKPYPLTQRATITPVRDGSRAGFRVEKPYMDSRIVQHIWLWSDSRRIDFDHDIDWHQHHQVLKLAFPLDVHTNEATFEIQYGHVRRPTHRNTSWDQAKYEVCAHKWVDLSENGYGVALLNDCKYGYSVEGSTLELTVLKAGDYPTDEVDQGQHLFSCSLLPHSGSLYEAGVIREAYSFNQPLETLAVGPAEGTLPERFSLASCDREGVIPETLKKAEADGSMILRLYDSFDRRTKVTVAVAPGFRRAVLCDLMENELEELPFDGKTVTVPLKNFEILTLKFMR